MALPLPCVSRRAPRYAPVYFIERPACPQDIKCGGQTGHHNMVSLAASSAIDCVVPLSPLIRPVRSIIGRCDFQLQPGELSPAAKLCSTNISVIREYDVLFLRHMRIRNPRIEEVTGADSSKPVI